MGDTDAPAPITTSSGSGEVSAGNIAEASAPWGCEAVYEVPAASAGTTVAFINPGPADPFVAAWSTGMQAAAKFYGVDVKEAFVGNYDFSKLSDQYAALSVFDPAVVGALADSGTGEALAARVTADGRKVLFMDTIIEGSPQLGLDNIVGGQIMGEQITSAVEGKLTGDWADRPIVVVGLTMQGCQPCDDRVDGAFAVLKESLPSTATFTKLYTDDNVADAQTKFTDVITANPGAVFIVAGLDDEVAGGAFNAIRAAGLEESAAVASIGGDVLAVSNISKKSPAYVASVDAIPYCEGWNWVEAALALSNGDEFTPYKFRGVITPENVDDYLWRLEE